jgi:hypothetical protein
MHNLTRAWLKGFARPDRRAIYEWARQVDLQGDYDPHGFFHVETSRHLILCFDLLMRSDVRMINIL